MIALDADVQGLTTQEAAARLAREGANEIPSQGARNWVRIVLDVCAEPMFALLLAAAAIYLMLGDLIEAAALAAFATFSVSIALVQEFRSERVLAALREMTSPRALVIRDGRQMRVPGRDVVRGDIVVLSEGDRVPADGWLLTSHDLSADESLLTGESVSVRKRTQPDGTEQHLRPGGDDLPCVFSGTLIVRGQGKARVIATGRRSEIGKIGSALAAIRTEAPRLREETRRIVRTFGAIGLAVSLAAGLLYGLARSSWLDGVLSGIAVGMSMLPEEFPLVLAVFTVMGAWRIAQARVLTRRAASIETLGAVTVLCTDKTGTLTENKMRVARAETRDGVWEPTDFNGTDSLVPSIDHLLQIATLAGLRDPFDPMERALQHIWQGRGRTLEDVFGERALEHHQGITPELLAVTQVWRQNNGEPALAATKGAPEAIVALCKLPPEESARIMQRTTDLAGQGKRVLAVAESAPDHATSLAQAMSQPFRFLGLVAFEDPLRVGVPGAVDDCRRAGIRVLMVSGDYPETARAIAKKAGLTADIVATGNELATLDDDALRTRVRTCDVFARILPEQKLRIVEALKANGEIVGMTGDGVNDAPSLRAAHIGIAMGGRGTDVAREASSIVLLDDDFGSIVKTIRLGRRIYDNLQKAMGYILAVHVPIAGLALLPVAFGAPLILTPALIAFLEMIIDPACSVIFEAEPEEPNVMRRPPRDPQARMLTRHLVMRSLGQGALALLAGAAVFAAIWQQQGPEADLRSLMLVTISLLNVALIFTHRSFDVSMRRALTRPNAWLWFGIPGVAAILTAALAVPAARDLFHLGPLHMDDIALSVGAAISFVLVVSAAEHLFGQR